MRRSLKNLSDNRRGRGRFPALVLIAILVGLGAGCAGGVETPAGLGDPDQVRALAKPVTLLPTLDSRQFLAKGELADLTAGATIDTPMDEVIGIGRETWQQEGFGAKILPYPGPLPETRSPDWALFPLRGLETDIGIGLELKRLELKDVGYNAWMPGHVLLDSALLPAFAVATLATDGHTDLGGRIVPSTRVRTTLGVELHVISQVGGGHILTKTYLAEQTDPGVTESRLFDGWKRSAKDGQEFGRTAAPDVIRNVFSQMAHDPEFRLLPDFARLAWADRVLGDEAARPETKLRILDRVRPLVTIPDWTLQEIGVLASPQFSMEEKLEALAGQDKPPIRLPAEAWSSPGVLDPNWLGESAGRFRLFQAGFMVLLKEAGRLEEIKMSRPLLAGEAEIEKRIRRDLSGYITTRAGGLIFRGLLTDAKTPWHLKRALVRLPWSTAGNGLPALVSGEIEDRIETIREKGPESIESLAWLTAALGGKVMDRISMKREDVFLAISADDRWAAPMAMEEIRSGNHGPAAVRAVRVLGLAEALPTLIRVFQSEVYIPPFTIKAAREDEVPLTATPRSAILSRIPDPVKIVWALGVFPNRQDAVGAATAIVQRWKNGEIVPEPVVAEAASSLGEMGRRESAPLLFELWRMLAAEKRAAEVRRASLRALARISDTDHRSRVLKQAEAFLKLGFKGNEAVLTEAADFIGATRFQPGAGFLSAVMNHPEASAPVRTAAMTALGRLASPEAETALMAAAGSARRDVALSAADALESLIRQRALDGELGRM